MHYLLDARWQDAYKIQVTFDDHVQKVVDLDGQLNGPVFEPLKKIEYFKTLQLDPDIETVVWDNGATVGPEFLYENGTTVGVPTPGA